jgi:hypothetical protein
MLLKGYVMRQLGSVSRQALCPGREWGGVLAFPAAAADYCVANLKPAGVHKALTVMSHTYY